MAEEEGPEALTMRRLGDLFPEGLEQRAAAPLLQAMEGDAARARAAFAFAHGMVMLELTQRLPPGADPGPAWQEGVAAFQALATTPGQPATAKQPH